MSAFQELQSILADWPKNVPPSTPYNDGPCERLRRVLCAMTAQPQTVGPGDLAGIVRQVLRREHLLNRGADPILKLPRASPWPTEQLWIESGVEIAGSTPDHFRCRAQIDWHSKWLDGSDATPPLRAAFTESDRREMWPSSPFLPLDSALEHGLQLPFNSYSCAGQRQAVQAAFMIQPGTTLVVNLPTGSGKSLVAWAPALMADAGMLTVMVTPTVALALDQERQLHEQYPSAKTSALPENVAWYGGLSIDIKREIKTRLREGTQRILITSPESLLGSLARPLYDAAAAGRLAYFVVDEAHLVSQWGNEFRPEFQSMCGMHRELLNTCPQNLKFRTLLLSATLTQASFDTLLDLFPSRNFEAVSAVSLRPEPEYWMSRAPSEPARGERVRELLRVVPRPFLLYVTTKDHANEWFATVRSMGILRSGCVHGATSSTHREEVIDAWRAGDLDCVVATSAFGLGMDKSDVRAVIHACIPESVDRYYQEVGRSGRDGRASVSFLVHIEQDEDIAASLSSDKVITVENGFERWSYMTSHAKPDAAGRHLVRLDAQPPHVRQDSDSNNDWNLRTLVLLNRAKIIQMESVEPPAFTQTDSESEAEFEERIREEMENYFLTVPVSIQDEGHLDKSWWEQHVEPVRELMQQVGWRGLSEMRRVLSGQQEMGEILSNTYELTFRDERSLPSHICAGCPSCRRRKRSQTLFTHPEPGGVSSLHQQNLDRLKSIAGSERELVYVACNRDVSPASQCETFLRQVIRPLVTYGIDEVAVPESWKEFDDWQQLHNAARNRFVIGRTLNEQDSFDNQLRVPRITCLLEPDSSFVPEFISMLERPLHIVFVWADIPHRNYPDKKFFDYTRRTDLSDFVRRLHQ